MEIKRLVKKEVNAAKESLKNAKEKATKARAMEADEDRKVTSDDRIAGAKQAEIERLQIKLKDTTSEKKMVKIFDRINKLKAAEDGTPALVNKEKAEKIRINEARLSAKQSATNAKERAEKKGEKERKKTEAREEEQTKETNNAMAKTNELARKQIDKVKAAERKKTLAAEKEADNLKATLLKFHEARARPSLLCWSEGSVCG